MSNTRFKLIDNYVEELIEHLNGGYHNDFTISSQITDRKPILTPDEVQTLKAIKVKDACFGAPHSGDFNNAAFDIYDKANQEKKVVVSNRMPTCGELRGYVLVNIIENEKVRNPELSLFDAINRASRLPCHYIPMRYFFRTFSSSEDELLMVRLTAQLSYDRMLQGLNLPVNDLKSVASVNHIFGDMYMLITNINVAKSESETLKKSNKCDLAKNVDEFILKASQSITDYIEGKADLAEFKHSNQQAIMELNKSPLLKNHKYRILLKALSNIANILIAGFTLGTANLFHTICTGNGYFFKEFNQHYRQVKTVVKMMDEVKNGFRLLR